MHHRCPACGQSVARPLIDPQTLAGFDGKGQVLYEDEQRIVATAKSEGGEVKVTHFGASHPFYGHEVETSKG